MGGKDGGKSEDGKLLQSALGDYFKTVQDDILGSHAHSLPRHIPPRGAGLGVTNTCDIALYQVGFLLHHQGETKSFDVWT